MSSIIYPHRRQFVLGNDPSQTYPDWICRQIEPERWLSHCPQLRVGWVKDTEGQLWALLGLAVQTLTNAPDPLEQIAQLPSAEVPENYASWAGRWVLIGQGAVHMDASGLLGCFFGNTSTNRMWVSSSPALLAQILSGDIDLARDPRELHYGAGISWFTPPRSRFCAIHRLLPSQVIDLQTGHIQPRPLMPPIDPARAYDETLALLQESFVTAVRRLSKASDTIWLGLTAGYDSRLFLAIARSAEVDVKPFTRIAARTTVADQLLPPKLAHELGYTHIFLRGKNRKNRAERQQLVAEHSLGHVSEGDAEPFITGVRDRLQGIAFGGHGFAIASGFADLRQLPPRCNSPQGGAAQIARLFEEPLTSSATAGLQDWLEWVLDHSQDHLDWRDRFFLEQRQAGWLSAKEQIYDLTPLERFPILNAARNYALLLSISEQQRLGSLVQVALLQKLAPPLLNYPFNPPDSDFGILRATVAKFPDDPSYLYRKIREKLF